MKTYAQSSTATALKVVGGIIIIVNIIGAIAGSVPFYDDSKEEIGTVILLVGILSGVVFGLVLIGLGELVRSNVNIEGYLLSDEFNSKTTIANPSSTAPQAPTPTQPVSRGNDTLPSI